MHALKITYLIECNQFVQRPLFWSMVLDVIQKEASDNDPDNSEKSKSKSDSKTLKFRYFKKQSNGCSMSSLVDNYCVVNAHV